MTVAHYVFAFIVHQLGHRDLKAVGQVDVKKKPGSAS